MTAEVDVDVASAVQAAVGWLDRANGRGEASLTCRLLKVTEEAGEAASAWLGVVGGNPRKGVTHTVADVADELADVAFTALVAIESLGVDHQAALLTCAAKVARRLGEQPGRGADDAGPGQATPNSRATSSAQPQLSVIPAAPWP